MSSGGGSKGPVGARAPTEFPSFFFFAFSLQIIFLLITLIQFVYHFILNLLFQILETSPLD